MATSIVAPSPTTASSAAPKAAPVIPGFSKPFDKPWVDGWRLLSSEEHAVLPSSRVCGAGAVPGVGPLSGPAQTLGNGDAVVRVQAVTDAADPMGSFRRIYDECNRTNPDMNLTHNPVWTSRDDNGQRVRSTKILASVDPVEAFFVLSAIDEGSAKIRDNVDLSGMAENLLGYGRRTALGAGPARGPVARPVDTGVLQALRAGRRARPDPESLGTHVTADDVLVVGRAWNKTIAVVRRETGLAEQAADVWMSGRDGRFVQVSGFANYDGTGLAAVLHQHPDDRMVLLLRTPEGHGVRVRTREGMELTLADAAGGRVVGLGHYTKHPWDIEITVITPRNDEYRLHLPVGGVIWVTR